MRSKCRSQRGPCQEAPTLTILPALTYAWVPDRYLNLVRRRNLILPGEIRQEIKKRRRLNSSRLPGIVT
ncbi:hypothetical protein NDU88_001630 [Pleurodeles waltl]|uniref:Uncharacterized protein n=1 Tax=Pleurodeles waltl TaxID=8319 RepID=A0AAV7TKM7_PLEWA|nr:hypothetical protein NDU88_001630 [Pleurodeles waltl]